jgi:geranylgeranyl pyrophosphate synthase
VEGETLQMLHLRDLTLTEDMYLQIVTLKTADLFAACSELGALMGGGPSGMVQALKEFGRDLGIAFQIRDDVLDWVGTESDLGKPTASDLEQGAMSLATIYALAQSERAKDLLFSNDGTHARALLHEVGAIDYAMERCQAYAAKAHASLSVLPHSAARSELERLAEYAVLRDR